MHCVITESLSAIEALALSKPPELCQYTATEQRTLIRNREISAVELLEDHLQWIDVINPQLNAIVTLAPEHARALADNVDAKIAKGEDAGLLAGLPVAHKDLVLTRDIRTTWGSRLHADLIPDRNALIVDRLVNAGAVTLGKTNTPEWGAGSQTFNEVFGATRNPYNPEMTCGGSSGGAATALAARMLPIADGSDMGGSLRNPASFCNVVGFRVSPGRVPDIDAANAWATLSLLGPMARTVEDCSLMLAAIAGPHERSPLSLSEKGAVFLSDLQADMQGTRIAFSTDFGGQLPVAAEIREVIRPAGSVLEGIGCRVEDTCPDFSGADETFKTLRAWSFAGRHAENIQKHPDMYKESIRWNVEAGLNLSGQDLFTAQKHRTQLRRRVAEFMQGFDFLALPVTQVAPFPVTDEYVTHIDGVEMETYIDWMKSCYYITLLGLPSISIPCGFTPEGLPVGLQLVGKHHGDLDVLRLAYAFEQSTRCHERKPQF
jgi:amidase